MFFPGQSLARYAGVEGLEIFEGYLQQPVVFAITVGYLIGVGLQKRWNLRFSKMANGPAVTFSNDRFPAETSILETVMSQFSQLCIKLIFMRRK